MSEAVEYSGRLTENAVRVLPSPSGEQADQRPIDTLKKAELVHYYRALYDLHRSKQVRIQLLESELKEITEREKQAYASNRMSKDKYSLLLEEFLVACQEIELLYEALRTTDPLGYLLSLEALNAAQNRTDAEDKLSWSLS